MPRLSFETIMRKNPRTEPKGCTKQAMNLNSMQYAVAVVCPVNAEKIKVQSITACPRKATNQQGDRVTHIPEAGKISIGSHAPGHYFTWIALPYSPRAAWRVGSETRSLKLSRAPGRGETEPPASSVQYAHTIQRWSPRVSTALVNCACI
jgi:hypothetical protein